MSFKPKFLKPGEELLAFEEERSSVADLDYSKVIFNPYSSLSIEQQRQQLPIFQYRNHLLYLLECFQTLVIVGETSCGKSTQVPQYLLEAGWSSNGKQIGVTEPRRLSATTLSNRVAEEKGVICGQDVGFSIRFSECCDPKVTKIKYMTEGTLVREMMADPLLNSYSVIMVDEAHERSVYTDILLGLLRKIIRKRPDLRIIISSATLEAEILRNFFNTNESKNSSKDTATIISIEGRNFPVDIHYVCEPVPNYVQACVDTVIKIHRFEPGGGILVFLTGQEEVEHVVRLLINYARTLKNHSTERKLLILPLYAALPTTDQMMLQASENMVIQRSQIRRIKGLGKFLLAKLFNFSRSDPSSMKVFKSVSRYVRRVIVATNIAEASLTIGGISYVVDCGFVKLRWYNSNSCTDCLVVVPVSQASADQRAGRAGRVCSGKTYRLCTEEDYLKLPAQTCPVIQRSSLASVILQLKALGIENILRFNFPAAPPAKNVINALELLYALGGDFECSEEAVIIVAMLHVENIFISPPGQGLQARKAKYGFSVKEGDHITLLNVYNAFIKENKSRKWCTQHFLNYKGLMRAEEIRKQLAKFLTKFKIPLVKTEGDVDAVCHCIVAGFFANSAYLHYSGVYKTICGDHTLYIHPSSVLYSQKAPQCVVFSEVLHTSKEYMRDVTAVEPSWLCELAPHYYQYRTARELAAQ
ncbi:putative ATP-dependent RNA helicase DHX35 isoform X2 [Tachypleus tridentatus]|uniref:putative ATP-dependent RNA helicase DHX35 isoform X2 n=1 Tax=Tachypleus tridentatus TaxID=6853 RepID=UPI003FD62F68